MSYEGPPTLRSHFLDGFSYFEICDPVGSSILQWRSAATTFSGIVVMEEELELGITPTIHLRRMTVMVVR